MLKLNSFLNECCFIGCKHGLECSKKQKKTPWYIGHRGVLTPRYLGLFWIISGSSFATPRYMGRPGVSTPRYIGHPGVSTPRYIGHQGVLTHKELKSLDSPVHRTPGSFRTILDHQQINFCDFLVHRTPGSLFKMYITPQKFAKNENGSRTSLVGPGGVV